MKTHRFVLATVMTMVAGGLLGNGPAVAAVTAADPGTVTIRYAEEPRPVPNSYIVMLKSDTPPSEARKVADELSAKYGSRTAFVYDGNMAGFSVDASSDVALKLASDPLVEYVAQDLYVDVEALGVQTPTPSWGIDRIDERSLPRDNKYHFPNIAGSVTAFIIDTGILLNHQEFGGRAICGFDPYLGGCAPCNQGHGTHVAGTVGGKTVGVAKGVRIISVRVFGCTPSAPYSVVIAGVNFVTTSQQLNPGMRSVANMSLGGPAFAPLDAAVTASIAANVHYSVAAGNSNTNACGTSPARVPRATTVGATDQNDNRAAFSSFGPCLDLFAPGVSIYSAWHTAANAYVNLSGTSMASPHAAGAAALWRHKFPVDNADQTATALAANATPGVVINPGVGSPNLLLFMGMVPV